MAAKVLILFILTSIINKFKCIDIKKEEFKNENFVFWPQGIIPFYIEPNHFDSDQNDLILAALTKFGSKSCLQFTPVFVPPKPTKHVLVLENPFGIRKCVVNRAGHTFDEPHRVTLGFECLNSPNIDMMIMRALGFPFEHNRPSRDLFIDVLSENIEPVSQRLWNMAPAQEFKLYENIFIETNLQSADYDGVLLILYPEEMNVGLPRDIGSYIDKISKLDKNIHKVATVWNCDYVAGERLVLSPTGKITPYHDVKVVKEAARKGMMRALDAGMKRPLIVIKHVVDFPDGQLVCILGALEALYVPLTTREREDTKNFIRIGFHVEEQRTEAFERVVRNAIALERSRIVTRDIAGGDPERMSPVKIVEYLKNSFAENNSVTIKVIENENELADNYPLLAAVNRAATRVERHKARIVELEYNSSDPNRVSETILLVGKGVTYDTGGADIKITGKMAGMSRDKCGAAAVAGFLKACAILKPPHLKVVGVLCLCRNSIGEDSYVADELLVSKSGKTVRVTNTDAEGRLAMADALYHIAEMAGSELNPHIYTIATLTGHAAACYGGYTATMDNHSAKATNHAGRLQFSGSSVGEGFDVSTVRSEDLAVNAGKCKGDDLVQYDTSAKCRNHQLAAGFLIKVSGLEDKNIKYTHLDIAGSAGMPPDEPTAVPVVSLCHLHKVLL